MPVANSSLLLLQASGEGGFAYSRPGTVSRFTEALVLALSGFAGTKVQGRQLWAVDGDDIARAVRNILAVDKLDKNPVQYAEQTLSGPSTVFHFETVPTHDFIELNKYLWQAAGELYHPELYRTALTPTESPAAEPAIPHKVVKVFISCADEDLSVGRRLYDDLKKKGHQPWLAKESLLAGQNWRVRTNESIRSSDLFICLLSSKSVAGRGYFQKELREAIDLLDQMRESATFIVPVRVDDCEPPQERLRTLFWVDLFPDYETGVAKIMKVVDSEVRH